MYQNTIDWQHNLLALAYGLYAAYSTNPLDSQGYLSEGMKPNASMFQSLRMIRRQSKSSIQQTLSDEDLIKNINITRGVSDFNIRERNTIPFPQALNTGPNASSYYDLEDGFIASLRDQYEVYLLQSQDIIKGVIGYMAIPRDPSLPVEIVFRGTQGAIGASSFIAGWLGIGNSDCRADMKIKAMQLNKIHSYQHTSYKVHNGFAKVAISVLSTIKKLIIQKRLTGSQINITGHSLGAALSAMTAYLLIKDNPMQPILTPERINLRAYACPCVGDKHFVGELEAMLGDRLQAWHIAGDPVKAKMPGLEHFRSIDLKPFLDQNKFILPDSSAGHNVMTLITARYLANKFYPIHKPKALTTFTGSQDQRVVKCSKTESQHIRLITETRTGLGVGFNGLLIPLSRTPSPASDAGYHSPIPASPVMLNPVVDPSQVAYVRPISPATDV